MRNIRLKTSRKAFYKLVGCTPQKWEDQETQ